MTATTNVLQQVQVYNRSFVGALENQLVLGSLANKKFKNFENEIANLGSSTTISLPTRFTWGNGLVASFQPVTQRTETLNCDQAFNVSYGFTAQERIFNVDKDSDSYMKEFGERAAATMATAIESNLAQNVHSAVPVNTIVNGQTIPTGALHTESGPYRFSNDGTTAVTSIQTLQQFVEDFRAYGAADTDYVIVLPNRFVPAIVGNSLGQFALKRNDELANSWELGTYSSVRYYESNLLPVHISGNVGNTSAGGNVLTVISTNDPTGANITQITCSGAATNDPHAIYSGDMANFVQGVSGRSDVRWLTFTGNIPTTLPAQIRVTTGTDGGIVIASDGSGNVTFNLAEPLQATAGPNQNISANIVAGMKLSFKPSHQCALLMSGDAFYVSMPRLPDQSPFATSNEMSPTGVSVRMTSGALFAQNFQGTVNDVTFGSLMSSDYCQRIMLPLQPS